MALMSELPEASVDAIVTDPPYGLGFMGKEWDSTFESADMPMRRNGAQDAVNAGASRQGGRQRAGLDYQKRMARDSRAFQEWSEAWAREALRILKPGGHLLAFGGTRTYHRLACAIEDAGFEIRDCLAWLYGSGFPKSLDVSKAIDKQGPPQPEYVPFPEFGTHYAECRKAKGMTHAQVCEAGGWYGTVNHGGSSVNWERGYGLPTVEQWEVVAPMLGLDAKWRVRVEREQYEREVIGTKRVMPGVAFTADGPTEVDVTAPGSPEAQQWQGWGTALKPAHEPIVLARKPLAGTVAANVLEHGTGALNVDGCRIEGAPELRGRDAPGNLPNGNGNTHGAMERTPYEVPSGRWPANVLLDEQASAMLDEQTGESRSPDKPVRQGGMSGFDPGLNGGTEPREGFGIGYGDSGGASRFLYVAKASSAERNAGLDGFEEQSGGIKNQSGRGFSARGEPYKDIRVRNVHPTVKPIELMRWLVRLVTPPGGTVLDPFTGSGTTGCAAALEGFNFIGMEREAEYVKIAEARIAWWSRHPDGLEIVKALEADRERRKIADSGQLGLLS